MKDNPFQAFPETVSIDGNAYPVNSDFRIGVSIEQEMQEKEPDVTGLLMAFYRGNIPADIQQAVEHMVRFYACTEKELDADKGNQGTAQKRCYDFSQDADALLASFLDTYGIDLNTAKIHWWTFHRLLDNLPVESPFMQRIRYRTADISKMGKEEEKHYKKMRKLYALKRPDNATHMTVEERDNALKKKIRKRFEEAQKIAGKAP